jgi:glucosylglycerate phosphorylase
VDPRDGTTATTSGPPAAPADAAGHPASRALGDDVLAELRAHLDRLYPEAAADDAARRLVALAERFAARRRSASARLFDETDVWLITYADQIREDGTPPLRSLHEFLCEHVAGVINGVHLLPFYPWTSDDGFAVADYEQVDPAVGEWADVSAVARDFRLMVDAVFNHVSAANPWFRRWLAGDPDYERFFVTADPGTDTSRVVRPRTSPLLTPVEAVDGVRHVWTTFSADQVDLDFRNPAVLLAVTEALLGYVERGAGIIRLDAIAYLWKELGTSCIHLPQTHEVIRLWRTLLDAVAPGTLLITETNVPHAENVSYFGHGDDEAHLVYQFPLAPLVLDAFATGDARVLQHWAADLRTPSLQTAFFNFLGSHDGVGVRPAEGLLPPARVQGLCERVKAHGGGVSYKANSDGTLSPYELNTVFFDALNPPEAGEPVDLQVARFLSAHSILLAVAGVPGVYVQALLGSRNWQEGVELTGRVRSINRQKLDRAQLEAELADPASLRHRIFTAFTGRIAVRIRQPAFHPNAGQRVLDAGAGVFAIERVARDGGQRLLCLHSTVDAPQIIQLDPSDAGDAPLVDLCDGTRYDPGPRGLEVVLPPYGVAWLSTSTT